MLGDAALEGDGERLLQPASLLDATFGAGDESEALEREDHALVVAELPEERQALGHRSAHPLEVAQLPREAPVPVERPGAQASLLGAGHAGGGALQASR